MKDSRIGRATMMRLETAAYAIRDGSTATSARPGPPPPRQGPTISERAVSRVVAASDALVILVAGAAAMQWDSSGLDSPIGALVVLLGTLLGLNLLHIAGAHRFIQFSELASSLGRTLLGWLCTVGTLLFATLFIEPLSTADGPWLAMWFSSGVVLLAMSRIALHHQIKPWMAPDASARSLPLSTQGPSHRSRGA